MRFVAHLALLLLIGVGGASAQTPVETITVRLSNFDFQPSNLLLDKGRTYRLRLVNVSSGGHDFTARQFFQASRLDPADAIKVSRGKVRVPRGQTVELTVTPERPGSFHLACTHFMHAAFGMTGSITVR